MLISSILPIIPSKLFRVVYDDNGTNILDELYDQWTDTLWLHGFFVNFKRDLDAIPGKITVKQAVKQTINDADELFESLLSNNGDNLSSMFKPLDNRETLKNIQAQKGRINRPRSWLRLYAVHYNGKYILTGGSIKLTTGMDRPHLQREIFKLELLRKMLYLDDNFGTYCYLEL